MMGGGVFMNLNSALADIIDEHVYYFLIKAAHHV